MGATFNVDEAAMLGAAILEVQKFEFVFYGLAAHVANENDKKRGYSGEAFLRGDLKKFKKTLGLISKNYAEKFLIDNSELEKLIKNRNILCHNYYRMFHTTIKGGEVIENPMRFLTEIFELSNRYSSALLGFIAIVNTNESYSKMELKNIAVYNEVVKITLLEREIMEAIECMSIRLSAFTLDSSANIVPLTSSIRKINALINEHPDEKYRQETVDTFFIKNGLCSMFNDLFADNLNDSAGTSAAPSLCSQ